MGIQAARPTCAEGLVPEEARVTRAKSWREDFINWLHSGFPSRPTARLLLLAVMILGVFFAGQIVSVEAPNYSEQALATATFSIAIIAFFGGFAILRGSEFYPGKSRESFLIVGGGAITFALIAAWLCMTVLTMFSFHGNASEDQPVRVVLDTVTDVLKVILPSYFIGAGVTTIGSHLGGRAAPIPGENQRDTG